MDSSLRLDHTHSIEIVQIYDDIGSCPVGNLLQHVYIFGFGGVALRRSIWCRIVRVVDHIVLIAVALAIEIKILQLIDSFGGGGLEVLEKVDKSSCMVVYG